MNNDEYQLTEDELGMLDQIQTEIDAAIKTLSQRADNVLLSIIKYRKLSDGLWGREPGGKVLKKQTIAQRVGALEPASIRKDA